MNTMVFADNQVIIQTMNVSSTDQFSSYSKYVRIKTQISVQNTKTKGKYSLQTKTVSVSYTHLHSKYSTPHIVYSL